MLILKACPRCHGDLMLEVSRDTDYYECLQCGHVLSIGQERMLGVPPSHNHHAAKRPPRATRRARNERRAGSGCQALSPAALALRRAFRPAYLPEPVPNHV